MSNDRNSPPPKVATISWNDCRLLIESVTDYAIFMLDTEGHVETWNVGAKLTKGYDAEEIVGRHFSVFYTSEDRAAGKPARVLDIARREGRFEEAGWRLRKDGTRFWADVVITALRDASGQLLGFAKVTRDRTKLHEAEEDLRRSEERFRLLVEGVSDYAIYMLDPEGQVTTWNLGAERMKGYSSEEILGRSFRLFFREEDVREGKPESELAVARATGRFEDEGWRVRKDGTLFWANVVVTALRDGRGAFFGFSKITRDLTARRAAESTERELLYARAARAAAEDVARRAEEANRIKDQFLATVSHELRTPLNAIVGWSALLRQEELEPQVARAVEIIDRNAKAQARIIEDILDVSRIVTGKLQVEPKLTDIVAIARATLEVVRPSATARRLSMTLEASSAAVPIVVDPERMQQVIWNLLSNAVKFTEPSGAVKLRIERARSSVIVAVTDTGIGIEPAFLPLVFDRFQQADASTTRRFGGLGLGLALVRHIVELHGGNVAVESPGAGRGSTFTIALPVQTVAPDLVVRGGDVAAPQASATDGAGAWSREALRGLRILVVDDEPNSREFLATLFTGAGAQVQVASSVSETMSLLPAFRPQVLVSDIAMPDEDGYTLMRRVRELDPREGGGIPSIALTAYARNEDRARALATGFTAHVGKPVEPGSLIATVAGLVHPTRG